MPHSYPSKMNSGSGSGVDSKNTGSVKLKKLKIPSPVAALSYNMLTEADTVAARDFPHTLGRSLYWSLVDDIIAKVNIQNYRVKIMEWINENKN